jgi:hypothetical protein
MRYLILLFFFLFILPSHIFAHGPGQPPMFLINGKYSDYYPIQTTTTVFDLPQDIAPETYLVNKPITFELDMKELANSVPEEVLNKTRFDWDFGDGKKAEGVKNVHVYSKPGSYVLTILGEYEDGGQKISGQVVQTVLLHVLPKSDYKLPQVEVKVNGKEMQEDPLTNPIHVNLRQYVQLDASESVVSSVKNTSFVWDFGNDKSSTDATVLYKYDDSVFYVMPVVRVTDENGFFSDGYAHLLHDETVTNSVSSAGFPKLSESQSNVFFVVLYVIIGGVFAVGIFFAGKLLFKR